MNQATTNPELLDTLARAYFINGKVKEAVETQKKAIKLEPHNDKFKANLEEYQRAMRNEAPHRKRWGIKRNCAEANPPSL